MPPERIIVVGSGGAGKSTFARKCAAIIRGTHVEIDALAFDNQLERVPFAVLHEGLARATASPRWVVEGMHRLEIREYALPTADVLVWLDPPLRVVAYRLIRRVLGLLVTGAERHGRRVHVRDLPREWAFIRKTIRKYRKRREYGEAFVSDATELGVITAHLRSDRAAETWLAELSRSA